MSDSGMQWWQTDGQFRQEYDHWLTLLDYTPGLDMHINDMAGSKFLKGSDVTPAKVMTIKKLEQENLAREDQPPKMKWIMYFNEADKGLVLNSTNIKRCAKALLAEDTDDWVGKRITLFFDPDIEFGGQIVGGIRIKRANPASELHKAIKSSQVDDLADDVPF